MLISPSRLALEAAGAPLEGTEKCTAEQAKSACAVCGGPLHEGELIDTLDLPESFTNHNALADPHGKLVCGACSAVMSRHGFQLEGGTVLVSAEGIFPIGKKVNRAWAFLTPPKPPFAIAIQNSKSQHTLWRAPVSLSADLIFLRLGEQVLSVRMPLLRAAREETMKLLEIRDAADAANKKKRVAREDPETPFVTDWKGKGSDNGVLKPWVRRLLGDGQVTRSQISSLLTLTPAECWVLTAILCANPVRPDCIASSLFKS